MSGQSARAGFEFQDLYLLQRVLRIASEAFEDAWRVGAPDVIKVLDRVAAQFGIEARMRVDGETQGAPDWDVIVDVGDKFEFAEVKSGAVEKSDRSAFWRRLRQELGREAHQAERLVPILVVDPSKAGDLSKWQQLASAAAASSGSPPSSEPQGYATSSADLLEEALWWLCSPASAAAVTPVEMRTALRALARFELHCHIREQLEDDVGRHIELLFPGGLGDTHRSLLLGWLGQRGASPQAERKLFTLRDLLAEIGILEAAISLAPGTLSRWRALWKDVSAVIRDRTRLQLGSTGRQVEPQRTQPEASTAVANATSVVVLGQGGAGKSTFIAQMARGAEDGGSIVLHCGAGDVDQKEVREAEDLVNAARFQAALLALRAPTKQVCLFVDGLDEADAPLRKRWAQLLVRVGTFPNARVIVGIRLAVWLRSDADVRRLLEHWDQVTLQEWSDELVREILATTPYRKLSQKVVSLLRTPILLDLFWQAFVEERQPDPARAARIEVRHQLLAAFWEKRILASPCHVALPNLVSRLMAVIGLAATCVGAFSESGLDDDALQVFLSEGVLVREGRLQPRLRFRHPLLRDFALAQWCLTGGAADEAAQRYGSIEGGLQRHGALRAIFEALRSPDAESEYPKLSFAKFVGALGRLQPAALIDTAEILGAVEPNTELDPASWPAETQRHLPAAFGRRLLAAARFAGNGTWAATLERWSETTSWLDDDFPREVWRYCSWLSEQIKAQPADEKWRDHTIGVARKFRRLSEAERFREVLLKDDRWLKMQAIICVVSVLPDEETLAWVERELEDVNWRTGPFILDYLINLAAISAERAASIYRRVVGLSHDGGQTALDKARWANPMMGHHAFDRSLTGEAGRPGLLARYPAEFMPLAIELAEGLYHLEQDDPVRKGIAHQLREMHASMGDAPQKDEREPSRLGELIDDHPEWAYWRREVGVDAYARCISAIDEHSRVGASNPARFIEKLFPSLRSSRLATVHSILMDILLSYGDQPMYVEAIVECLLDARLYHVFELRYWIEAALVLTWPRLQADSRVKVLDNIAAVRGSPHLDGDHYVRRLLARIPAQDVPQELCDLRPADGDPEYRPCGRPRHSSGATAYYKPITPDKIGQRIGDWPADFDRAVLKAFCEATYRLIGNDLPANRLKELVPTAIQAAANLTPVFRRHAALLTEPSRLWVWRGLTDTLNRYGNVQDLHKKQEPPPPGLVIDCAELALTALEEGSGAVRGEIPDGDTWYGRPESEWPLALDLADASLIWPPVRDDSIQQGRFECALKQALERGDSFVQLIVLTAVRPWHWFRNEERKKLHWQTLVREVRDPRVLSWAIGALTYHSETEQLAAFKTFLMHAGAPHALQLARQLGGYAGRRSLAIFSNGQRSRFAELAHDILAHPDAFPLLTNEDCRVEFLRSFAFALKEAARQTASHTELAPDFGSWNLQVWRELCSRQHPRGESQRIVLFAMHWLEKSPQGVFEREVLRPWWQCLRPLLETVVAQGKAADCFTVLFGLRHGHYNDIATPEELMALVSTLALRLESGLASGALPLDERRPAEQQWHTWRECADHAAECIDSLRRDGSIRADMQREEAYVLLSRLAAEPIHSQPAVEALHHLHNE